VQHQHEHAGVQNNSEQANGPAFIALACVASEKQKIDEWISNSGATQHITGRDDQFMKFTKGDCSMQNCMIFRMMPFLKIKITIFYHCFAKKCFSSKNWGYSNCIFLRNMLAPID